jgi:hypothetical protein
MKLRFTAKIDSRYTILVMIFSNIHPRPIFKVSWKYIQSAFGEEHAQ